MNTKDFYNLNRAIPHMPLHEVSRLTLNDPELAAVFDELVIRLFDNEQLKANVSREAS